MVDLKIPFEGTYEVTFGVQTRGGYVYGEPCHVHGRELLRGLCE